MLEFVVACSDSSGGSLSQSTDVIFYQLSNGRIALQLASSSPGNSTNANIRLSHVRLIGRAAAGSRLRAVYNDGSLVANVVFALVLFNQTNRSGQISYIQITRDGRFTAQGLVRSR
jgi:hypothetical protein